MEFEVNEFVIERSETGDRKGAWLEIDRTNNIGIAAIKARAELDAGAPFVRVITDTGRIIWGRLWLKVLKSPRGKLVVKNGRHQYPDYAIQIGKKVVRAEIGANIGFYYWHVRDAMAQGENVAIVINWQPWTREQIADYKTRYEKQQESEVAQKKLAEIKEKYE